MRRLFMVIFCLLLFAAELTAQQAAGTARRFRVGSALPSTCSMTTGDVFFLTSGSTGPYYCSAANTWTSMGAGAGALTGTGVDGRAAYWSGSTTLASSASFLWDNSGSKLTVTNFTLSGATANSFLYSGTASAVANTAAATNGQLLIGSTGSAPVAASLTAGSSKLTVTNGAGSITLDVAPANITITDLAGTLSATKGGTAQTTWTTGDLMYASASNTLSKLAVGSTGQFLTVAAGVPAWTSSTVSSHRLLSSNHSDVTAGSPTRGDLVMATGATPSWAKLATGSSGTVLRGGTEPSWGAAVLTTDVSGILPTANGGTGIAFFTAAGPTAARVFTFPDAAATVLTTNDTVTVAQGGTGIASGTQYGMPYFSTTTLMASTAAGTSTQVLHGNASGAPTWSAVDVTADISGIVPVANGGTGIAYFTAAGPTTTRTYTFPDADSTIPRVLTGSAALDFGSTAAQTSAELTITVTGATAGDVVALGIPTASVNANSTYTAYVSASDTVTVKFNNYSSGAIDPASGTFKVKVFP